MKGETSMDKISKRYMGAMDWLVDYKEYFYTDPKTKRIMMNPNAPEAAAKSFDLYKEANRLRYNHIGYDKKDDE